jgi:plastocyanin
MNAFLIAGAVLAVWAVLVSLLGMRGFPRNRGGERAAILITAVLFVGAVGSAIADQTKVGERKGPELEGAHKAEGAAPARPGAKATTLALAADPGGALKFDKTALDAPASAVTIEMTNAAAVPHDISLRGPGVDQHGKQVSGGGKSTVQADVQPGSYEFYCSVPGHEQAGMKGTLTVK